MKKDFKILLFLSLILVIVGFSIFIYFKNLPKKPSAPPPIPTELKKHSNRFNDQIDSIFNFYFAIKDAFVQGDTLTVKKNTQIFLESLNRVDTSEIKAKDTSNVFQVVISNIDNIKSSVLSLLSQNDITEMRKDFYSLSESFQPFLRSSNYQGKTRYVLNCPMAFGENSTAIWIDTTSDMNKFENPYLGKNHPQYKSTMLHCGEVVDSIYGATNK